MFHSALKQLSWLFVLSVLALPAHALHGNTLILTQSGHKAIKDIQVGDVVLSKNEATNKISYQSVTHQFSKITHKRYI